MSYLGEPLSRSKGKIIDSLMSQADLKCIFHLSNCSCHERSHRPMTDLPGPPSRHVRSFTILFNMTSAHACHVESYMHPCTSTPANDMCSSTCKCKGTALVERFPIKSFFTFRAVLRKHKASYWFDCHCCHAHP